jgi:alpha-L-fucosidase
MKKTFIAKVGILSVAAAIHCSVALAQKPAADVPVAQGPYSASWESLSGWECPEWFKDAKFGIWAHWGPQCQAEDGDWYGRFMYYEGSGQFKYHVSHYGNPSEYGLKELIRDWKAEKWNPEELVALYKSVGARYFFTLGQHHDNFDLWDSPYQEWNSVNLGPKRDIVGEWAAACKKYGLPLGVSMHGSHAWTWLEGSQRYDGNLTKEDGTGKWWEGLDPQELYAQRHAHSTGWEKSGTIHSQWDWANGASLPSEEYKTKFQNRVLQCINDYEPKMLYFDDTVLPFYGCDDQVGLNILKHYYNRNAGADGQAPVVVMGKILKDRHKQAMLWDVERGTPDRIQEQYWQTCTCIGDWHYNQSVYTQNRYKGAQQVVDMLIDVVSKNGNLLLSIPVRADGTIDDKERAILGQIKEWMDQNGESIYGTRPWKTFGEGPLAEAANPMTAQGFNEKNNYSARDVRYVQVPSASGKPTVLYATIMRWPDTTAGADGQATTFTFKALGNSSQYYSGKVKSVKLLGHGKVKFTQTAGGLQVTLPSKPVNKIAPVFAVKFK